MNDVNNEKCGNWLPQINSKLYLSICKIQLFTLPIQIMQFSFVDGLWRRWFFFYNFLLILNNMILLNLHVEIRRLIIALQVHFT